MKNKMKLLPILLGGLGLASATFGADLIETHTQAASALQNMIGQHANLASSPSQLKVMDVVSDKNQTVHVRYQQTFRGFRVWGGEVLLHMPHAKGKLSADAVKNLTIPADATSNGLVFNKLENDLLNNPPGDNLKQGITEKLAQSYLANNGLKGDIENLKAETIVYIANNNKATWAYLVSFIVKNNNHDIAEPHLIIDAESQTTYQQWDGIEHSNEQSVLAGGFGGNDTFGKRSYDGVNYPSFQVKRVVSYDPLSQDFRGTCYMDNEDTLITEDYGPHEYSFACHSQDSQHNNLYWSGALNSFNGGYSTVNDIMYGVESVIKLYNDWYHLPVVTADDHVTPLKIVVNTPPSVWTFSLPGDEDAMWVSYQNYLVVGRGGNGYYPFTSPEVIAHELAHAFTIRHSNLSYHSGSGAMNESFSDMASQAMQYYLTGKNDWRIEKEIIADPFLVGCRDQQDCAIRYMDTPTKDEKSYDDVLQAMVYDPSIHYSSGIFNKMFYLLATSPNWNTKMAFDVAVKANQYYWITGSGTAIDYKQIACGMIAAAKDYQAHDAKYDVASVIKAFKGVGFKDDGGPLKYREYNNDIKDCE